MCHRKEFVKSCGRQAATPLIQARHPPPLDLPPPLPHIDPPPQLSLLSASRVEYLSALAADRGTALGVRSQLASCDYPNKREIGRRPSSHVLPPARATRFRGACLLKSLRVSVSLNVDIFNRIHRGGRISAPPAASRMSGAAENITHLLFFLLHVILNAVFFFYINTGALSGDLYFYCKNSLYGVCVNCYNQFSTTYYSAWYCVLYKEVFYLLSFLDREKRVFGNNPNARDGVRGNS